jgi:tetratricopeptide (TPR) repeat protein
LAAFKIVSLAAGAIARYFFVCLRDKNAAKYEHADIGRCTAVIKWGWESTDNLVSEYYNRGHTFDREDRHDEAFAGFTKAIALKPDYPEDYNRHGKTLARKSLHDEAIDGSTKAIALRPDYAATYG